MDEFNLPQDFASRLKLQVLVNAAMARLKNALDTDNTATILQVWATTDPLAKAMTLMQAHRELHEVSEAAERMLHLFDSPRVGELERVNRSLCEEFHRLMTELKPALRARVESGFAPWDPDAADVAAPPPVEKTEAPLTEFEQQTALRLLKSIGPSSFL